MIPKIEKWHIDNDIEKAKDHEGNERPLSNAARLEVKVIQEKKGSINGFKFMFRGDRCVAIGRDTKNDFDVWEAAAQIQHYVKEMHGKDIDRFRFAFI